MATRTVGVGVVLALVGFLSIGEPWPSVLALGPLLVVLPAFTFGQVAALGPALVFWGWNPQLFRGGALVPARSAVLLGLASVLTPLYLYVSWPYGLRYQGATHVALVAAANAIALVVLWISLVRARRCPSAHRSLVFHGLLFGWLGALAFPYLGEGP